MVDEKIYCFWTGDNPITPNRRKGLDAMHENLGVPIEFLDAKGIEERILPDAPLHPGYRYLSNNHKSDYLRAYFMHHFGGGYADIKPHTKNNNWRRCFAYINNYPEIELIGQHESKGGIAAKGLRTVEMAEFLVACGWMIARPYTPFTTGWIERVNKVLDGRLEELRKHPATEPFGGARYPLRWGEVCGEVFHKWQYEYFSRNKLKTRNCLISGWQGFAVPYR